MTKQDHSKSTTEATEAGADPFDMQTAEQALKTLRPKLDAIAAGQIQSFRAPAAQVVANILRVYRSFREDGARLSAAFKAEAFDPAWYDNLPLRAQALWHADARLRQLADPTGISAELIAKAEPLKKKLLRAAGYLWDGDVEVGSQIEEIRAGRGYLDLADDLVALAGVFGAHWSSADGKCDVGKADVVTARSVASELMAAIVGRDASREAAGRDVEQVREVRDRAATYARDGVDEVRAAAAFIYRHEPEAWSERYPSFFQGVGGTRRTSARPASAVTGAARSATSGTGAETPSTRPPIV